MRNNLFLGVAMAALAIPAAAVAQQITTGIEGTVADAAGTPIANAEVTITDTRTGATRTVTTSGSGTFRVESLVTGGPYTASATAAGFETDTVTDINTTLQGNTNISFALAAAGKEVVVTGARRATTVTQLQTGPGTSFGTTILNNAPTFNRDVRDIIRIDPRVSLDRDDSGNGADRISCLGGNDRGNTFTVDGIPQSDIYGLNDTGFSSRSSTPLPYDAIRETQVQFAPFDVDYGQFTGCAINVVTKSGTNNYHFGGFFEYSDNGLRGNSIRADGVTRPVASIRPEKRYGGYLSGPIIKDRLFLFGAYEHQEAGLSQDDGPVGGGYANPQTGITVAQFEEIRTAIRTLYGVETGDLVTSRDYKNDRFFVRADLQINDKHRLEATYQRLKETTVRPDDLFTGNSPQAIGRNTYNIGGTKSDYYSGRLYSQWSDVFSTELRYSRSKIIDIQDPIGGGEAQDANPIPRIIVGIDNPVSADNPTGIDGAVLAGPGNSRASNDLQTRVQQFRAVGRLSAGNHSLKFGAELNRADLFNLFVQNATGTLVFRNINDLRAGLLSPGTGNNNTSTTPANVISGSTEGAFGNFTADGNINTAAAAFKRDLWSAYVQDEWRITDQLKLTAGIRTDWYNGGSPGNNPVFQQRYGISNTTGFSNVDPVLLPRVAVNYDFQNSGLFSRTNLRAGLGIFSGGDPLVWFGNAFQNDGNSFALASLQSAGCPTQGAAVQVNVRPGGTFTGIPACVRAAAAATAQAGQGNTQSIDPDIETPTVLRANLGIQTGLNFTESGFFSGWNLNLDYIYSKYRKAFTLVDLAQAINPAIGLNGFTVDGRPIYRAIDLLAAGCTGRLVNPGVPPQYTGLNAACFANNGNARGAELMLTNGKSFRSHIASVLLSKNISRGLFTDGGSTYLTAGYAYTNSHDRRNMYNSTAGSNYGQTAAFDRQDPDESVGFFQSRHNISFSANFRNEFVKDYGTSIGFTFVAREGRPYSLTFTGNNVFNTTNGGLTTNDNALAYIPTGITDPNISPSSTISAAQLQSLVDFTQGLKCARKYAGRSIPRNTCTNDWYKDVDLTFSQELPGPGHFFGRDDKIRLYATVDNFLNLLNKGWNVQRRRNFYGVQDIAQVSGIDAQGRYIFSNATALVPNAQGLTTFDTDNQVNVSSSVWRMKVGISYNF